MQTPDRKHQMFDMQEHPENYSEEQIEVMMDELDQTPDVETAWQKFERQRPSRRWLRIAASIVGVLMVSGIAIAAIHIWTSSPIPYPKSEGKSYIQTSDTIKQSTPLPNRRGVEGEATVIFDNVPLDTMLNEMAGFYQIAIEFQREETRQLRLHFVWKRSESLDRVLERLNNFEAVNIIREPEKLIVR